MTEREKSEKERRNERLQAALRENLRRRKAQARERVEKSEASRSAGIVTEEKRPAISSGGEPHGSHCIVGGKPLNGTIPVSGAKNATLPLMIAACSPTTCWC
jgi:hypothetical protein